MGKHPLIGEIMFKTIHEATETVMSRRNQTYGIDSLIQLFNDLGKPQDTLKTIHIGGTNGKGSTTNFTRSILESAGFKVGTFTSPHLITHNDRIRIHNEPISDADLLSYINQSVQYWDEYNLSMFEIDMLVSVWYFIDAKVDYVIYEVGLGGRLDATNVITPCVSAITNVGLDHQGILGDTVEKIAFEKAGIIKKGVPFVTSAQDPKVLDVFLNRVIEVGTTYQHLCIPYYVVDGKSYLFEHRGVHVKLTNQGAYQVSNASLAIDIVFRILPDIDREFIVKGLESTAWAGRFEEILPQLYLDGAHNEMGITQLIASMQILPKPWTVYFTALKDKDHSIMVDMLCQHFERVVITSFDFYRAASSQDLAHNHDVEIIDDMSRALADAYKQSKKGTVIVTGSLYFISEARAYFMKVKENQ